MASGRMEFHAQSIMQHANFSFVLPNDVEMEEVREIRHYDRPPGNLILLHGLTGTDTDWLFGGMAQMMAIQYNLNIFMPTTGNSFYLDRGYDGCNFSTFVGEEFPEYIRETFGLQMTRENTFIGGLSMGGYGAIHTALAYPDVFSACIALSSAIHIREIAGRRSGGDPDVISVVPEEMLQDIFGDPETLLASDKNPEVQFRDLKSSGAPVPSIYMACGTEDALIGANRRFRDFLAANDADHYYEEGPGKHDWFFWNEYLDRGLRWVLRSDH